jgi:SMI1 / KNR4 family (SUKH-1)
MKTIDDIEQAIGYSLPAAYKKFVSTISDFEERHFEEGADRGNDDDHEDADNDGDGDDVVTRPWFIWGLERLTEDLDMRDVGSAPMFNALSLYTKCYAEFTSGTSADSPEGEISLQRIANGFVFGEENGDYIYMDAEDDFSIWFYYHDGGDVKCVAPSFADWLNHTTIDES